MAAPPKSGACCDACKAIYIEDVVRPKECPECAGQLRSIDLVEVPNRPRLVFFAICAGLTAIVFVVGMLAPEGPLNTPEPGTAQVLLTVLIGMPLFLVGAVGIIGFLSYTGVVLMGKYWLGFGGWRWLTKTYEPSPPPAWFVRLPLKQALWKEAKLAVICFVVFCFFGLLVAGFKHFVGAK